MKELSIPEKITLEKDVFGIPKKDVKKFIALALPGAVIGVTVWLAFSDPLIQFIAMILTIGYLFLCYVVTARVEGNPSILNYLELLIRFRREQQRFNATGRLIMSVSQGTIFLKENSIPKTLRNGTAVLQSEEKFHLQLAEKHLFLFFSRGEQAKMLL